MTKEETIQGCLLGAGLMSDDSSKALAEQMVRTAFEAGINYQKSNQD